MRGDGQGNAADVLLPGINGPSLYMIIVGPRADLQRCGKIRTHKISIPEPFSLAAFRYTDLSILAHISFLFFP